MKKIISVLTSLLLIWAIWMFVDYVRAYQNEDNLLVTFDMEVTREYTKKSGLGYHVKFYDYDINDVEEGQVIKEFAILNFVVSKEVISFEEDE